MSACWRTTSATASLTRAPSFCSSTASPRALARIICRISAGRGRLPAWVVRILSVERFMSYCALMFADLTIGHHFSISAFW